MAGGGDGILGYGEALEREKSDHQSLRHKNVIFIIY